MGCEALSRGADYAYFFDRAPAAIELVNRNLDLTKAEDALSMLQTFGLDDLDASELERALEIAYSGNFALDVDEDWDLYKDSTKQEYLEFWGAPPFWQPGGFGSYCMNPDCSGESLRVIGYCSHGVSLLIVFQYCDKCHWIFTTNQA